MKITLPLSLCVLLITQNTTSNGALQLPESTVFAAIDDCQRENWRTYQTRTWLEFSEDGKTVTFRIGGQLPELSEVFVKIPKPPLSLNASTRQRKDCQDSKCMRQNVG